jgi:serine protease AprX
MKKLMLILIVIFQSLVFAQAPVEKRTDALISELNASHAGDKFLVWVFFEDKGNNSETYFSNPELVVSEKSLQRRSKMINDNLNKKGNLLNIKDLPVNSVYIEAVESLGLQVRHKSKWFNGVSGFADAQTIDKMILLPFVKQVDRVVRLQKDYTPIQDDNLSDPETNLYKGGEVSDYNYGNSFTQMQQINVPAVHNLGYTGQGVTICVMDAGFNRLTHEVFADMNIIATWDFVNNREYVGDGQGGQGSGTHGTNTLSVIGGFKEGQLIGPAFSSDFILAKTENTESETPIEEDNWIAAIEWADSIGVDVTSTSLGYLTYDPPYPSYTWEDMDGNTMRITIAADLAVSVGIVVVNSAGNGGFHSTRNTLSAPADGDSVISAGAVTSTSTRSSFSSVGPTVDGRIKPDVMAMGSSVRVASASGNTSYTTASGTSFSCPLIAGVAALVLNVNPYLTPIQVRDALRNTASQNSNPDRLFGWGIIDALQAVNYFPLPVELISFTAQLNQDGILLKWVTASEQNNLGFEIQRKNANSDFYAIGFVEGNGTSLSQNNYSFYDNNFPEGKITYRLKQIDFDGSYEYSSEIEIQSGNLISYKLYQNYPNPFNPATVIKFINPKFSYVKLKVYDILGNEVATLIDGEKQAGIYEMPFNGENLSSGIYMAVLNTDGFRQVIKMTLAK